jgi:hypothetical protein
MSKISPVLLDDESVYKLGSDEVELLLNSRRLFDFGFGSWFDASVVKKMNLCVGLLLHTTEVIQFDDSITERYFDRVRDRGVQFLYAIPTGYLHNKGNSECMEVSDYHPPLLGKIPASFRWFSKIRGGQIGLYSRSHYLFSSCLSYAFLDVDGKYSLILGDDEFVRSVVGIGSWDILDRRTDISPDTLKKLNEARVAYGYKSLKTDAQPLRAQQSQKH